MHKLNALWKQYNNNIIVNSYIGHGFTEQLSLAWNIITIYYIYVYLILCIRLFLYCRRIDNNWIRRNAKTLGNNVDFNWHSSVRRYNDDNYYFNIIKIIVPRYFAKSRNHKRTNIIIILYLNTINYCFNTGMTWKCVQSTCVLETDFGLSINCGLKKTGMFRVRNLGGLKGYVGLGKC